VSLHPLGGGAEHKRKEMKNYAGSENHSPHEVKEK